MSRIDDFGKFTFNKSAMKRKLPYPIYLKWKNAIRKEELLDKDSADIIAHAMKEWAIEKGATHYCHWFQPLNGNTAKKHESFISKSNENLPIVRFSGEELLKSEPDASSFPNGGMRSTFEARGYTYWDCTANAFIMDNILYIPSIFVSFDGISLDKKAPLLKSMDFLSKQATALYNLFSDEKIFRVKIKVGLEQEFFLIDRKFYEQRVDLINTGRTLIGEMPPKDQELLQHYFGSIPKRVMNYYNSINKKLEDLGINSKTEHNEVAPGQFEVAILYDTVNVSVDNNQIVMEVLRKTAYEHDLVCLLHEKPFKNVNGSGKHNNWSLVTNYGKNLFKLPKKDDEVERLLFAIFMISTVSAVNKYSSLLRVSSSSVRNDLRLGGDEAPPSIVSVYLGNEIENILDDILDLEVKNSIKLNDFNISNLEFAPRDTDDRNRTSPFAYTDGKFEFRMLGSMQSAADCNIVLNTIVASELKNILQKVENINDKSERITVCKNILKELFIESERILFSGDNYSKEWIEEAEKRGLKNNRTYLDALLCAKESKEYEVLLKNDILNDLELSAVYDVCIEDIKNTYMLEMKTLVNMINKDVIPSCIKELNFEMILNDKIKNAKLNERVNKLNNLLEGLFVKLEEFKEFEKTIRSKKGIEEVISLHKFVPRKIEEIRKISDEIESNVSRENWNIPTYEEMFRVLN